MVVALCKKRSCPSICHRVCHCPAGLERSHQLLGQLRNRRLFLKGGFNKPSVFPRGRWREVEVDGTCSREPNQGNCLEGYPPRRLFPFHYQEIGSPRLASSMFAYKNWWLAVIFAVIIAAVVAFGFLAGGGNLSLGYTADQPNYPPCEWMWER